MRYVSILPVLMLLTACGREIDNLADAIRDASQAQQPNSVAVSTETTASVAPTTTPAASDSNVVSDANGPAPTPTPTPTPSPNDTNAMMVSTDPNKWYGNYQSNTDLLVGVSTCATCAAQLEVSQAVNNYNNDPAFDSAVLWPTTDGQSVSYTNLGEEMNGRASTFTIAPDGASVSYSIDVDVNNADLDAQVNPGLCALTARRFDITWERYADNTHQNARRTLRDTHVLMCQGGHQQVCTCTYQSQNALFFASQYTR